MIHEDLTKNWFLELDPSTESDSSKNSTYHRSMMADEMASLKNDSDDDDIIEVYTTKEKEGAVEEPLTKTNKLYMENFMEDSYDHEWRYYCYHCNQQL